MTNNVKKAFANKFMGNLQRAITFQFPDDVHKIFLTKKGIYTHISSYLEFVPFSIDIELFDYDITSLILNEYIIDNIKSYKKSETAYMAISDNKIIFYQVEGKDRNKELTQLFKDQNLKTTEERMTTYDDYVTSRLVLEFEDYTTELTKQIESIETYEVYRDFTDTTYSPVEGILHVTDRKTSEDRKALFPERYVRGSNKIEYTQILDNTIMLQVDTSTKTYTKYRYLFLDLID